MLQIEVQVLSTNIFYEFSKYCYLQWNLEISKLRGIGNLKYKMYEVVLTCEAPVIINLQKE